MKPMRYELESGCPAESSYLEPHEEGEWIKFEDYEKLLGQTACLIIALHSYAHPANWVERVVPFDRNTWQWVGNPLKKPAYYLAQDALSKYEDE